MKQKLKQILKTKTGIIILSIILVIGIITITNIVIKGVNETVAFINYQESVVVNIEQIDRVSLIASSTAEQVMKKVPIASWYDYKLKGIKWSKNHRTAASRDLPRYSYARVTNLENGKSVEVFINDFGPELWTGRDIDLSSFAFSQIADLSRGLAYVEIEPLK